MNNRHYHSYMGGKLTIEYRGEIGGYDVFDWHGACKHFLDEFDTLDEAQKAYPELKGQDTARMKGDRLIYCSFDAEWDAMQKLDNPIQYRNGKPIDWIDIQKQHAVLTKKHMTRKDAKAYLRDMRKDEIWQNDIYDASVRYRTGRGTFSGEVFSNFDESAGKIAWLSIKRHDRKPIHDWRDLQRIKNDICGVECEAMEIYPAESRLVDTANQYHLFCFTNPEIRIPIGFDVSRRIVSDNVATGLGGAQRPRAAKKAG